MGVERFPWLNDAIMAHQNITFPSSSIIEGEKGLAKKQLAKYFAQKLLCTDEHAPCGKCNSCNYFLAGSHPDYCFLDNDSCSSALHTYSKARKDSLTSNKIDGIRAVNEFISMTNSVSEKRIAIVFEANSMNIHAQNALLKTLEELPINKHIFLVSNQRKYFLPTIYSRSSLITIKNPNPVNLDQWIADQGYIDFSSLNFAPDSTPLQIEHLINNDLAGQYMDISQNLNSYCLGKTTTPDLLKFYKEMNISFDEKINSIILFLKTCVGINQDFYKSHPSITSIENIEFDTKQASDLIEELIDYKYQLNKVSTLNEQIGLNNFFYKIKNLFS
tara:strand:+ start:1578 stop:2570 length:993 start_codon:yes stop_codon:yes gene_type:complete